jgi:IclR family pca regulon transcriptional regulator
LDGDEVLYIASEQSARRILGLQITPGIRLPAYCTSIGRLLLSGATESRLDEYLHRVPVVAHTPNTITDRRRLVAEIATARRQGWTMVVDELEEGQSSVAVPLHGSEGAVVAAMNVSAQSPRLEACPTVEAVLHVLREVAASIEVTLRAHLRPVLRSDSLISQTRGTRSASR